MYKEILRAIAGIDVYPIVSLLLFVTVFAAVVIRVVRLDRTRVARCAGLPLDPSPVPTHEVDGEGAPR